MPSYQELMQWLKELAPKQRQTQVVVLALLAGALLRQRVLTLSGLTRAWPLTTLHLYRVKRLWRWLSNPRVNSLAWSQRLIEALATRQLGAGPWLPLLVDFTPIRDPIQCLWVAIPWRRRAIPLAAIPVHQYYREGLGPHPLVQHLMAGLLAFPVVGRRPLVIGDRGLGQRPLVLWLCQQGIDFVLRTRYGLWLLVEEKRLLLRPSLAPRGRVEWRTGVAFPSAPQWRFNLVMTWQGKEPWFLLTTLPSAREALHWYRKRVWIDEMFRDLKQHFGLTTARVTTLERWERLLLGLLVALVWLALVGWRRLPERWLPQVLAWGKASVFWLTWQYFWANQLRPHPP